MNQNVFNNCMGLSASKPEVQKERSQPSSQTRLNSQPKKKFDPSVPKAQTEKIVKIEKKEVTSPMISEQETPQPKKVPVPEPKQAIQFTITNNDISSGSEKPLTFSKPPELKARKLYSSIKSTRKQAKLLQKKKEETNSTSPEEKADYIFMLEKVKELSETVRELNDRVAKLENGQARSPNPHTNMLQTLTARASGTSNLPLKPEKEVASEQPSSRGEAEDLIKRMKDQLRKREPVMSFLKEQRALYKKKKMNERTPEAKNPFENLV